MIDWLNTTPGSITLVITLFGVGIWAGRVMTKQAAFSEFMKEMKGEIKEISTNVARILTRLDRIDRDVISESPLRLTNLGEQVADTLEADDWAEKIAEDVYDEVQGKRKYEIQIFSFEYAKDEDNFSDGELELIQEIAYDHGMTESRVRRVLGIKIKDKLISMLGLADDADMPF